MYLYSLSRYLCAYWPWWPFRQLDSWEVVAVDGIAAAEADMEAVAVAVDGRAVEVVEAAGNLAAVVDMVAAAEDGPAVVEDIAVVAVDMAEVVVVDMAEVVARPHTRLSRSLCHPAAAAAVADTEDGPAEAAGVADMGVDPDGNQAAVVDQVGPAAVV